MRSLDYDRREGRLERIDSNVPASDLFQRMNSAIANFFANGWNIVRFGLVLAVLAFGVAVLLSAFSAVPAGESVTVLDIVTHAKTTFSSFNAQVPVFGWIFEKITGILSQEQLNFLLFLSCFVGTITVLTCACR
jgi:hypothetical protein